MSHRIPGLETPASSTREYSAWSNMRAKCYSPSHSQYKRFLEQGIYVCARWNDSFENFYADMGPRPEGMWLVRLDSQESFTPENCKWGRPKEILDQRPHVHRVAVDGELLTLPQVAERTGLHPSTVRRRRLRAEILGGEGNYKSRLPPEQLIDYEGETLSIAQWAERSGVPYDTLKRRLLIYKWEFERAVNPAEPRLPAAFTYQGRSQSLNQWAKEIKVSYGVLYTRIMQLGWSFERAITQPLVKR